jgi:GrpB-like predicted nucleotidyltransferase (UPF0157 family)
MADDGQITPEQREVELVPHNPEWSQLAEEESKRILEQLSIPVIGIYHIGSTSVPGIKAKPILDFVIEVEDLDEFIQSAEKAVLHQRHRWRTQPSPACFSARPPGY